MSKQAEIKIELFKFTELTYKPKKGVTAKIMTSGKLFKLSVDDSGRVALMSEVGIVKLEFSPSELDALAKAGVL
ncbi:hypothetical protein JS84_17760 [Vibrio vulnificus]|uniref:hypothetical protein n=1 Tax=Vibrio vulnificus TaxID=672 RepID=UPI000372ABE5|nr:hypothetical protein [Vibrio vulnificus]EWS68447.1 hypothetical protein Y702_14755 [Vibrio vulnificus BAA87]KFK58423.1 hypothetical protein JS83_18605 [Vibrio vulnificus]KFK63208.1 hypothetical protein JS84_17760 [Vibrio vulnificus]KFK67366.1 hypothetical protein JS85_20310 [Vibrio vulnificus]